MKSGTIGWLFRNAFASFSKSACCCFGSRLARQLSRSGVVEGTWKCSQFPVADASWPEGVYSACDRFERKKPYGEPCDAPCQSSDGFFVDIAFGCHEFQSGSSATFE